MVAVDVMAVVNGLLGDSLADSGSRLATGMTARCGDTVLSADDHDLHERVGGLVEPGDRLCVLVHGLMSTESIWQFPTERATTYGTLLATDHGVTVLSVRYNTGRHVSANGRELARLLDAVVAAWPRRVREISLVGHSMGGLVVRSALHYGRRLRPHHRKLGIRSRWTGRVRRVVLIGTPHTGAGLEVLANSVSAALWALPCPPMRLAALGLDRRSAGIKDLRFGAILDEDWLEHDPGACTRPHPHRPLRLRRARHLLVAGSLTADPVHPVARFVGDALVTAPSAQGRSPDGELFQRSTTRMFPGVTHQALAHDREVYEAISEWW